MRRPGRQAGTLTRAAGLLVASWALVGLGAGQARADITGFQFKGAEGLDGLNLSDRFGTTASEEEHFVNIEDCERYQGRRARFTVRLVSTAPTALAPATYSVAYTSPGGSCAVANNTIEPVAVAGICYVAQPVKDLESTDVEFTVDLDELVGSDCETNTEKTSRIYIWLSQSGVLTDQVQNIDIEIDLARPEAPEVTSITPGDQRLRVSWSDEVNDDDVTYTVYWNEAPFGDDELGGISKSTGLTATSYAIDDGDLVNEVPYYVGVVAVDDADNESPLSNLESAAPVSTTDFWEHYQASGGPETGGFCFVATAAYGTPMAGQLTPLRRFRDGVLLGSGLGRAFVGAYYKWGRYAAAFIADRPVLRAAVRVALVPLVWFASLANVAGLPGALLASAFLFALFRRARRRALAAGDRDLLAHLEASR